MSNSNDLNKEVQEYIDKLNKVVQNNKEAVEIYNVVDKTHRSIFPKFKFRTNLYYGLGFLAICSLFYFLYLNKMPNTNNVFQDSLNQQSQYSSQSLNKDTFINQSIAIIDTNKPENNSGSKSNFDSIIKPKKKIEIDSVIEAYTIKVDKKRYKIFDVSSIIIKMLKNNDFDILISDISRDKGKIITRNKTDYSNTFGKMIFFGLEYYIISDDLEYNIKMNLINKSSNVNYSDDKKDKIPNPVEEKFYELMKEHITSFYGD